MEPILTVTVITYNQENVIRETLDSILSQEVNFAFEIIVGDDASSDTTPAIIQTYANKYPGIVIPILRKKNLGHTENYIETTRLCKSKYIAHIDGDDLMLPNKLQKQVDFLEKHPECSIVHHPTYLIDGNGKLIGKTKISKATRGNINKIVSANNIVNSSNMFRRDSLDQTFYEMRKDLLLHDWLAHIIKAKYGSIGFIPEYLGSYRVYEESVIRSTSFLKQCEAMIYTLNSAKKFNNVAIEAVESGKNKVYFTMARYYYKLKQYRRSYYFLKKAYQNGKLSWDIIRYYISLLLKSKPKRRKIEKKKILFILKNENESSARFRVKEYFPFLKNDFYYDIFYAECKISSIQIVNSIIKRLNYLSLLFKLRKYDIIFMQRPMSSGRNKRIFFEKLLTLVNPNLVFDFDDALYLHHKSKIINLIKISKLCICGNEYLASFTKKYNKNVYVIPTCIDTKRYKIKDQNQDKKNITLGWTGTSGNYQFFTDTLISAIKKILEKYSHVNFLFICDHKPTDKFNFNYNFITWTQESEISDLQKIDIGIMPLDGSEWSKGKCAFKLIQYGGIGIPSVASSVGVNNLVLKSAQTGCLIQDEEEWIIKLEYLINNQQKSKEYGLAARHYIEDNFSIQKNYKYLKEILMNINTKK